MEKVKGLGFTTALSYYFQGRKIKRAGSGKLRAKLTMWMIHLIGADADDWEVA